MGEMTLYYQGIKIGLVDFFESPDLLNAERTATGIAIQLPASIGLRPSRENTTLFGLGHLRFVISMNESTRRVEVGRIFHDELFTASVISNGDPPALIPTLPKTFTWHTTLTELSFIERLRSEKQPRFDVALTTELYQFGTVLPPTTLRERCAVTYPVNVWTQMIQHAIEESQGDPFLMLLNPIFPFLVGKTPSNE